MFYAAICGFSAMRPTGASGITSANELARRFSMNENVVGGTLLKIKIERIILLNSKCTKSN